MRRLRLTAVWFALLACGAAAQTGGLRPGQDAAPVAREPDLAYGAYQRGLFLTALREATARLDRDPEDAAAMTLLGELHNQGLGVRQDTAKAAEWYRLAARRGDAHALAALGLMAIDGRGMDKNPGQGKAWLETAAEKGDPIACYNLALLLLTTGANADLLRAVDLLRTAAQAEIGDAQHALGALYLRGRGVTRDTAEAGRWFFKAAGNGSTAGEVEYAILLFNGEGVPKNEALAARYFRHAASNGNAIAQNRLARLYAAGRGVPKNLVEAAAWHLAAASQGLADAWLDGALRDIAPEDRARAERLAAERAGIL